MREYGNIPDSISELRTRKKLAHEVGTDYAEVREVLLSLI